jgi:hypothetical protein
MKYFDTTSDKELNEYADILNININQITTKDNFKGMVKNGFYIANLDNVYGPGTHWTCFYCVNKIVVYFDSFGLSPPKDIVKFCKGKTIIYNTDQIQHIDSQACGYYCLAFIVYFNKIPKQYLKTVKQLGYFVNIFIKPFDVQNLNKNELILKQQFKDVFLKL